MITSRPQDYPNHMRSKWIAYTPEDDDEGVINRYGYEYLNSGVDEKGDIFYKKKDLCERCLKLLNTKKDIKTSKKEFEKNILFEYHSSVSRCNWCNTRRPKNGIFIYNLKEKEAWWKLVFK